MSQFAPMKHSSNQRRGIRLNQRQALYGIIAAIFVVIISLSTFLQQPWCSAISTRARLFWPKDFASTLTHDLKTPLLGAIETVKSFSAEPFARSAQRSTKSWR